MTSSLLITCLPSDLVTWISLYSSCAHPRSFKQEHYRIRRLHFKSLRSGENLSQAMDSSLWGRLAQEILCLIVEYCDHRTQLNWSCTSQLFYEVATHQLWKSITITAEEIITHCLGKQSLWRELQSRSLQPRDGAILHFLVNDALRQRSTRRAVGFPDIHGQTAKLPGSRIKTIELDCRFKNPTKGRVGTFDRRRSPESALKRLFAAMPNLHACSTEGFLFPEILECIIQEDRLRALRIRSEWQYISQKFVRRFPHPDLLLDFTNVAHLTQLRSLTIGRLAPGETTGLALAVRKVEGLTELSVSAIPPCHDDDMRIQYAGSCQTESPIIMFLNKLWSIGRPAKNEMKYALPQGLKHLVLRDFYRPVLTQNHAILHDIITPCSDLETLRISLLGIDHVKYFLSHAGLTHITDFTIGVCPHVLHHDTWLALHLMIPNLDPLRPETQNPLMDFVHHHQHTLKRLTMNLLAKYDDALEEKIVVLEGWQLQTVASRDRKMEHSVKAAGKLEDTLGDVRVRHVGQWLHGTWICKRYGACFVRNRPKAMTMQSYENFRKYPERL